MSSVFWKEFLTEVVTKFRKEFNEFTSEEKKLLTSNQKMKDVLGLLLLDPSQIVVFDFVEPYPLGFLITHNSSFSDLEFYIYERVSNPKDLEERITKEKPFWLEDIKKLGFFKDIVKIPVWSNSLHYAEEHAMLLFAQEKARKEPEFIVRELLSSIKGSLFDYHMDAGRKQIGRFASDLKHNATRISEPDIRAKVLDSTSKIDRALNQMKQLEKYEKRLGLVEEEIGGVRRLVGTKTYGEWRVLVSDIDRLKEEHVPREIFDVKVGELHTRINSLSEMKTEYDKLLSQQVEFMKQQAEVMKQQSSFVIWIKYATIFVPIAVVLVPVIDVLLRHFLNVA